LRSRYTTFTLSDGNSNKPRPDKGQAGSSFIECPFLTHYLTIAGNKYLDQAFLVLWEVMGSVLENDSINWSDFVHPQRFSAGTSARLKGFKSRNDCTKL